MPVLSTLSSSSLRPVFVPWESERWDRPRIFLFLCGFFASILCGSSLSTLVEGGAFWIVALMLQVWGTCFLLAGSKSFWHVMGCCAGRRRQVIQRLVSRLSMHRRRMEVLQTCLFACIGTGAVASLRQSAFLDMASAESTFAVEFCQAFAQVIALFCMTALGLFVFRNIVLFSVYRMAIIFRKEYARAFVKPMQMSVPDLSKEAPGMCSVCLISLADDEGKGCMRLFCGHTFHNSCIHSWLDKCEACPLCRARVPTFRACTLIKQKDIPSCSPTISDASTATPAESLEPSDVESDPTLSSHASPCLEFARPLQEDEQASAQASASQILLQAVERRDASQSSKRRREKSKKRKPAKPQARSNLQPWPEQSIEESVRRNLSLDFQGRDLSRSSGESQYSARSMSSEGSLDSKAELRDVCKEVIARSPDVRRSSRGPGANFDQVMQWAEEGTLTPEEICI